MVGSIPFTFETPALLILTTILATAIAIITAIRRPSVPAGAMTLVAIGIALLALAAGGLAWERRAAGEVAVMVDLSPSTRGAEYQDAGALELRIEHLLGDVPYRVSTFGESADKTVFTSPADAPAVVLFSDARFELPTAAPPTYVVVDPDLEHPNDAAIARLELTDDDTIAATVRHTGPPRSIDWTGVRDPSTTEVREGSVVLHRPFAKDAKRVGVQLSPGDQWPENDVLRIDVPAQTTAARWWVGTRAIDNADWTSMTPDNLPTDPAAYLTPAVIVLDNVAATDLSITQQQQLQQFVRDLGGGLVILGGDRAFAAGDYTGSILESLSPLSSTPPTPTMHWIILADSSGSMAAQIDGSATTTRWQLAAGAVARLLPSLPPADPVSVGSFAEQVQWWSRGKSAQETAGLPLPPTDVSPRGPTNLQPALQQIASEASSDAMPRQLLVMTDAQMRIDDPDALAASLKRANIRLHVLAIGSGEGLATLKQLTGATQGSFLEQLDPQKWTDASRQLLRQASAQALSSEKVAVAFAKDLPDLPRREMDAWNRTWLKSGATELAGADLAGSHASLAARWQLGSGKVAAAGFVADPKEATALADLVAAAPRDPRFAVSWDTGDLLHVQVDAIDNGQYLNGEDLVLELRNSDTGGSPTRHAIPQAAPGRYALDTPAPSSPTIATVRRADAVLGRASVAGRYPPEFDAVGNDRAAMKELAGRTGGAVIEPSQTSPIDFRFPRHRMPLGSMLAIFGGCFVASGLIWWRVR